MLRNLNVSSGGKRICGITRVGVLASEIPTGFALPSFLAGLVSGGDPVGTQYRARLLTRPGAPASLSVDEWGRAVFDGPDGVYTGGLRDYKSGVQQVPDGTWSITVGAASAAVNADLVVAYDVRSAVSADLAVFYNVRALVYADLAVLYDVEGTSGGSASADLVVSYDVRRSVSRDLVVVFNILAGGPTQYARAPAGAGYSPRNSSHRVRPADIQGAS